MATIDQTKLPKIITDKYSVTDNTFIQVAKPDWKDKIEVEIGDAMTPDSFIPQQKIKRWDNECNVSIRLQTNETGTEVVETLDDKIVWKKGTKIEAHFYDIPDGEGAREFEIILKSKPKTNVVSFSVVDKDVDYFYQTALTPEEIAEGANRPENVIGSYAVYAKTPKTNWTGGKEYKVGKVGHIYRPKIIDSVGTEVWGTLHIENGILSVTIPQDFLDKAVYPVRHAAGLEIGYHTNGGTSQNEGSNPYTRCGSFTASGGGTISKISIYHAAAANNKRTWVVYDSGLSKIDYTAEYTTIQGSANWVELNAVVGGTIIDTNTYWIGYSHDASGGAGSGNYTAYWDSSGTSKRYDGYPPPSTLSGTAGTLKLSLYATYTPNTTVAWLTA